MKESGEQKGTGPADRPNQMSEKSMEPYNDYNVNNDRAGLQCIATEEKYLIIGRWTLTRRRSQIVMYKVIIS